jgi:hypothetical protein
MSLVFGIALAERIYLVSDTRLTVGSDHQDDFCKWHNLNGRLGVVAAGYMEMAGHMFHELRERVGENDTFTEFDKVLTDNLKDIATEFYTQTGSYKQEVGLVFGGYDPALKLQIESGKLGDVMAPPLKNRPGQAVDVQFHPKYFDALRSSLAVIPETGEVGVPPGTLLTIDSPRPRVVGAHIYVNQQGVQIKREEVNIYEGLSFHPNWETDRVQLPLDLVGELDFGPTSVATLEQQFYDESAKIISYVKQLIQDRKFTTVGGNVLTYILTSTGLSGFPIGQLARRGDAGKPKIIGGTWVDGKGRLYLYDKQGKLHLSRNIYDDYKQYKDSEAKI